MQHELRIDKYPTRFLKGMQSAMRQYPFFRADADYMALVVGSIEDLLTERGESTNQILGELRDTVEGPCNTKSE